MKETRNQFGRTMVEMLAVLAIIGVLTVGAIAGLSQAIDKYRIGKMHDDILSIDSGIVDLYSWQRRYPDSNADSFMPTLCKNNVFPDGCVDNVPKNLFGGNYVITIPNTRDRVVIEVTGIPGDICKALISDDMDWGEFLFPETGNPSCNSDGSFVIVFQ